MNDFGVSNTTTDVTNVGPLAQQLSISGPNLLTINLVAPTLVPITIATLKQAALSGVVIHIPVSAGATSDFTLNKKPGAPNGSVAIALASALNLTSTSSSTVLKFHNPANFAGTVRLSSDDTTLTIQATPMNLFTGGVGPAETHVLVTRTGFGLEILFQRHTTPYVFP